MALAGQEDDVTGARSLEGRPDRGRAIGDEQQVLVATAAGGLRPLRDLLEDRDGVLAARILVGRDHEAAALAGHASLDGPLRDVALAGRPEDRHEPAPGARERGQRVECRRQRGRRVGVVDDDQERLPAIHPLHPAPDAAEVRKPAANRVGVETQELAQGDDRQRVVNVEAAHQRQGHLHHSAGRRDRGADPAPRLMDGGRAHVGAGPGPVGQQDCAGASRVAAANTSTLRIVEVHDPAARP